MTVDTKAIEKVITIAARPETVFRLLTDPSEFDLRERALQILGLDVEGRVQTK